MYSPRNSSCALHCQPSGGEAAHADNPRPPELLLQQPEHEETSAWSLMLSWLRKSIPWNGSVKLKMNKFPVYLRGVCSTCPGRSQITPKPTGTPGKGNPEPEFLKNILPVVSVFYSHMECLNCLGSDCSVQVAAGSSGNGKGAHQEMMLSDPSWVTRPGTNRSSALMEKITLSKVKPIGVFPLNSPEPGSGDADLINWSWTKPQETPGFSSFSSLWSSLCDL